MSGETWGKRPKKVKHKRDSCAKPKRGRKKKQWGVDPKAAKAAKKWGKPTKEDRGKGLFDHASRSHKSSWLSKWLRPERVSLVKYYHKLDQMQASEIQAGVREQLAQRYESQIEGADTLSDKLTRFVENLTRRRLSSGQVDDLKRTVKEVISPQRVVAFVTNLFK